MNPELNRTASEIRYEQARIELIAKMATECPDYQPEMIARHYTSLAMVALELLRLCEQRRRLPDTIAMNAAIDYLVDEIKRHHLHDFGIPLVWRATP